MIEKVRSLTMLDSRLLVREIADYIGFSKDSFLVIL